MRAVGFRRGTLSALLLEENLFIFLLGFAVAWLSALVAASAFLGMVPPLAETGQLLLLLLAVIAGSTLLPLRRALRASPAGVLRTAE
jgi:ABC-type antimicrobial peptide transport system permease subunit